MKKTLIIGANDNPDKPVYTAIETLREEGHEVVALGLNEGVIGDVKILTDRNEVLKQGEIHTVSLYIRPALQPQYYDFVLGLNPKRIYFNPGTENEEFRMLAQSKKIECVTGCMIVALKVEAF